jgi:hypothetical protein
MQETYLGTEVVVSVVMDGMRDRNALSVADQAANVNCMASRQKEYNLLSSLMQ